MQRTIIHINIASFFVAIERGMNPRLRSYPVAVVAPGRSCQTVLDVSGEGYAAGVRKGMVAAAARRLCPDLTLINPSFDLYQRVGASVVSAMARLSPAVEYAGPGHVFVDLTGTGRRLGCSVDAANAVFKQIGRQFRLPSSVGLASNKLVSKVATRVVRPSGLCSVLGGCEETFLSPLPLSVVPGFDDELLRQLQGFNIHYVKQIDSLPAGSLAAALGRQTALLVQRCCRGIDDTPVQQYTAVAPCIEEKAVLAEQTNDRIVLETRLFASLSAAGLRLRGMGKAATKLALDIVYADGSHVTAAARLSPPVASDIGLFRSARALFEKIYTRRVRLASMIICLMELTTPYSQTDLFSDTDKENDLMAALDQIKKRFGPTAIGYCGLPGVLRRKTDGVQFCG
ncbi:MAG: hypothetical protein JW795_14535 [Chitinivibrionales bacterium]|nr:hypothetical protein [Chitinivibrionales bacterium]